MNENSLRIVLCIKPVKSDLLNWHSNQMNDLYQMNPYEMMALENILKIKSVSKIGIIVTCVCMGPRQAEGLLRKALAMGADEAVLISDSVFGGSDTVATSYILAQAIKKMSNISMIVCGLKTIDGETGQVPAGLSERLGISCIINASEIVEISEEFVVYKQDQKASIIMSKCGLPVVLSFSEFKIKPPVISLLALKRAKNKEIQILDRNNMDLDIEKCGFKGSKTKVIEIQDEFHKKESKYIEGNIDNKVKILMEIISGNRHLCREEGASV